MPCEALDKVISIARKNPKILLSPAYFEKISARLDIAAETAGDRMIFRAGTRDAECAVITPANCREYKCMVKEGQAGIRIFEFIKALVHLLTDEKIPPSPHEKMGPTAEYYCEHGTRILQDKNLNSLSCNQ